MVRVYVDMVADLFHYGHMEFLRKARALGDFLLVGICSDDVVKTFKGKPILTMEERIASVAGCRYADEVIPDVPWIVEREWIELHNIHLIVHGDDYSPEVQQRIYRVPIEMGIFRVVPYTPGVSTTEIVQRVLQSRIALQTGPGAAPRVGSGLQVPRQDRPEV